MFLVDRELGPEQFLKALNFIPPKGTTIAYFVSPHEIGVPKGAGFDKEPSPDDESITYYQTEPVLKQDQAVTPGEYSQWNPSELGRKEPTPNVLPPVTEPEMLASPFVKVINETEDRSYDLKLLEDFGPFLKNTIFHCKESDQFVCQLEDAGERIREQHNLTIKNTPYRFTLDELSKIQPVSEWEINGKSVKIKEHCFRKYSKGLFDLDLKETE